MKRIKEILLQKLADFIINRMESSKTNIEAQVWMDRGLWLDEFCIENFELYLE
jgi:hypothetical protein